MIIFGSKVVNELKVKPNGNSVLAHILMSSLGDADLVILTVKPFRIFVFVRYCTPFEVNRNGDRFIKQIEMNSRFVPEKSTTGLTSVKKKS